MSEDARTRRRRAIGKVIAYAIVALPGAYSAVRSQYQAETTTVAAVNREKADQIVRLQEWVRANKAELEAARRELAEIRREAANDRRELVGLLVKLARSPRRQAPIPEKDLAELTKRKPLAAVEKRVARPKLRKPADSLEQVQKMAH